MLNLDEADALRIEYLRQTEILCAKIAKFSSLRKVVCFKGIWILLFRNTVNLAVIPIELFNRSI